MVLVGDECRVEKESGIKSIWYPKGEYPAIEVEQEKEAVSFYGALNVKTGKQSVRRITGRQNSANTVLFLEQLEDEYQGMDVLLIWDGAPSHRGEVKVYLRRRNKKWRIEIIYFPAYSPDLNPEEKVWKRGKANITHNNEDGFATKVNKFEQYLLQTKFNTNFLRKYS